MKYCFIIFSFLLSLGLFADPPEGMSPKAQRLWKLFFESNITYSGAVELLTEQMHFRDGEDRALIEFFNHPEVAKRIKIGKAKYEEHVKNILDAVKRNKGKEFGFNIESVDSVLKSIQDAVDESHGLKQRTPTQADIAFNNYMSSKYQGIDWRNDPMIMFNERRARYDFYEGEAYVPGNKLTAKKIRQWRINQLERLKKQRAQNIKAILISERKFKANDNDWTYFHPADPKKGLDGRVDSHFDFEFQGKNFTPEEIEKMDIFYAKPPKVKEYGVNYPRWYLKDKKGNTYALINTLSYTADAGSEQFYSSAGFSISKAADIDTVADIGQHLREHVTRTAATSDFALDNMIKFLEEAPETDVNTFVRNLGETTQKLVKYEDNNVRIFSTREGDFISTYFWGVAEHGDDFWLKREAEAERLFRKGVKFGSRNEPLFRSGFISELFSGLFSDLFSKSRTGVKKMIFGGGRGSGISFPNLMSHRSEHNIVSADNIKSDKLFKIKGKNIPEYFSTFNVEDLEKAEEITLRSSGAGAIEVNSVKPISSFQKSISIPTPDGHDLNSLTLKNEKGEILKIGDDYIIKTMDGKYVAVFEAEQPAVKMQASFKPGKAAGNVLEVLPEIPRARLQEVITELKGIGFLDLAENLELELHDAIEKKLPLKLENIKEAMERSYFYTYMKANEDIAGEFLETKYGQFLKYLDHRGKFCSQCTGASGLFDVIANDLFQDHPHIEFGQRSVIIKEGNYLRLDKAHRQAVVKLYGKTEGIIDLLSAGDDPRKFPMGGPKHLRAKVPGTKTAGQKYLEELAELRKDVLKTMEETGYKINTIARPRPAEKITRTVSILNASLADDIDMETARVNLQKIYKDVPSFKSKSALAAYARKKTAEQFELLKKEFKLGPKTGISFATKNKMEELVGHVKRADSSDLLRSIERFVKYSPDFTSACLLRAFFNMK